MSFLDLTSEQLIHAVRLVKQRHSLEAKLATIDQKISRISHSNGSLPSGHNVAGVRKRKRVLLTKGIMALLTKAGSKGARVPILAKQLKVKPQQVFSWFYTTGKTLPRVQKIAKARYALR